MRDSFSFSSSRYSGYPSVSTVGDNLRVTTDEDDLLSSMRSAYSTKGQSISSHKSKASKSSKRSRQIRNHADMREDEYSGRPSMKGGAHDREEDDVLFTLPESMKATSVNSKRSEATPIPRDLVIKSRTSNSSHSRKSKSSHSKSNTGDASSSTSKRNQADLKYWSALSVQAAMAVLKAGGSEEIANEASNVVLATGKKQAGKQNDKKTLMFLSTKLALVVLEAGGSEKVASAVSSAVMTSDGGDSDGEHESGSRRSSKSKEAELSSVTSSIAAKRRELKAKEIELEEKRRALAKVDEYNRQIEKEVNERIAARQKIQQEADAPSITSSMAAKRRLLKARENEEAERRKLQREKDLNDIRKQEEEDEVAAMQKRLMALEKQLTERKRELKVKEEDRARKQNDIEQMNIALTEKELDSNARLIIAQRNKLKEREDELQMKFKMLDMNKKEVAEMTTHITDQERAINNKFEAMRKAEEERLKKEKEIERKAIDFAKKEQEINERLALLEEASIARRQKEKMVEEKVFDFTRKEKEINDRLAAIDAASVARRKKEKEIEHKILTLAEREQRINEKLGAIDSSSVISRQKRQVEERERELEMEEKLRLIELNKKEQLIIEKNNALEEAMKLNIQRENEIRERMMALDAATNALIEKANAVQAQNGNGGDRPAVTDVYAKEEDWCPPEIKDLKQFQSSRKKVVEEEPIGFFAKYSNNIAKAFEFPSIPTTGSLAKAFDHFSCSRSSSEDYMPKDDYYAPGNFDMGSDRGSNNYHPNDNYQERHLSPSQSLSQENTILSSEGSDLSDDPESYREQHVGSKQINDSLNQALKASMQLYGKAEGHDIHVSPRPSKSALKMVSANPTRTNLSQKKKGGLKNKLKSVLRKTQSPKKNNQVSHAM